MRARYLVVAAVATAVAAAEGCKEETVASVTIDLGVGNRGSEGFACTEERSTVCAEILDCALKPGPQNQTACFNAVCRPDAGATRECAAFLACRRETDAGIGECYESTCARPRPLMDRARDEAGGANVHLLVDYVALGGTPGCRVAELRSWCAGGRCVPKRRRCVEVHLEPAQLTEPQTWTKALADGFARGVVLDEKAPDEPVVVRVVGVAKAGPCSPEEDSPVGVALDEIVGCAYSCPTVLSVARGALTVDLDLFGNLCTDRTIRECVDAFASAPDGG